MVAVSFKVRERRLVLDGPCWPEDADSLVEAVREAARTTQALVLDLTRVTVVSPEVATAILRARCAAEAHGCGVTVWTLPDSAAERGLADAMCGGPVSR